MTRLHVYVVSVDIAIDAYRICIFGMVYLICIIVRVENI